MMNALQVWQYREAIQRRGLALQLRRRGMGRLGRLGGLDPATIATYASNAGFSGADLYTAVAIALAESSGNPNAYNPETQAGAPRGKGSYGLWQIYLYKHPEFAGANLFDPQANANAAYAIYSAGGDSFGAWSTYNSLAFQKYMPAVTASAAQPSLPLPTSTPAPTDVSALTIDASTGQPVDSSVDVSQLFNVTPPAVASSGGSNTLLYGGAALAALVLLSMRD